MSEEPDEPTRAVYSTRACRRDGTAMRLHDGERSRMWVCPRCGRTER